MTPSAKNTLTLRRPFMPAGTALNVRVRLEVKKEDCWIGAFWRFDSATMPWRPRLAGDLWLCLLPMLPLHVWWWPTDPEGAL